MMKTELDVKFKMKVVSIFLTFLVAFQNSLLASTQTIKSLEEAEKLYSENPSPENYELLQQFKSNESLMAAYPYMLAGLIFFYVMMRLIIFNRSQNKPGKSLLNE